MILDQHGKQLAPRVDWGLDSLFRNSIKRAYNELYDNSAMAVFSKFMANGSVRALAMQVCGWRTRDALATEDAARPGLTFKGFEEARP